MKIGVIGLGPVGSILTAHLHQAGLQTIACDINPVITDAISRDGIQLTHTIEASVRGIPVCRTVTGLGMYDLDLVIVAVKASVMEAVFRELQSIDQGRFRVLCAQNGIDNETAAAAVFGPDRVLRMVINYAGNMAGGSTVFVSFFHPPNYITALTEKSAAVARQVAANLTRQGLQTEYVSDIRRQVWEKAILNSALNAVCAITRRTMKDVMDFPGTLDLVEGLLRESIDVATGNGIHLPEDFLDRSMTYLKTAGHHKPSMLADMEGGRRTEVDWLNGKVAEYGKRAGIPTPLNTALTAMVHLMEFPSEYREA
ncbi:MAG: 2-dehydropantoate 2-reductase [Candidatus Neomarinimicrobiota bacterium]|nr:MAG: 2-dehydropantoate 2-reductase [Candidatus Neomarinimicrobiota bacterium]